MGNWTVKGSVTKILSILYIKYILSFFFVTSLSILKATECYS